MKLKKTNNYKVFELGDISTDGTWTTQGIIGLDEIYTRDGAQCSGAVGLLYADDEYPGCCQMFYTWRSQPDNNGDLRIEFYPAYTKDGDYILIKTPTETPYVIFNSVGIGWKDKRTMEQDKIGYLTYKTNGWNS